MEKDQYALSNFSDALANAVEIAGNATVLVDARRRMPASGFMYAPDLVLTADHVVEMDEEISVVLPDNRRVAAKVAGRDAGSDIALLRLEEAVLQAAQPSEHKARVGQLALAVARPSMQGVQASLALVSAVYGMARTRRGSLLPGYLRTEATPYPGFSGGPLVDGSGAILGLNTSGLLGGALLTIPAAYVWQVADALAKYGHLRRGYLGVRSQPVELPAAVRALLGREQRSALLLVGVEENAPAAKGGLMVGDMLVSFASQPLVDPDDLMIQLAATSVGNTVPVQVVRGGQLLTIEVTIGES